jgi:hypothetical protein
MFNPKIMKIERAQILLPFILSVANISNEER